MKCRFTQTRVALTVAIVGYGLFLAFATPAGFPASTTEHTWIPYLSVRPVGEDAYYYLSVAWNVAAGQGFSADGMTVTTGIQPLMPLLLTIPATLIQWLDGTKWHLIRSLILIQTTLHVLFAYSVAGLARRLYDDIDVDGADVTFVLAIANYPLFELLNYGLETGLYLVALTGCLSLTHRVIKGEDVHPAWLGLVFGVTGWIRIDFGVALAIFYVVSGVRGDLEWRTILASGATALAVVAPWLGFVWYHTGTPMPSSGIAESQLIVYGDLSKRLSEFFVALLEVVVPVVDVSFALTAAVVGAVVGALVLWGLWQLAKRGQLEPTRNAENWFVALGVLTVVYLIFFRSTWFYPRYFSPLSILVLPALARLFHVYAERFAAWIAGVSQTSRRIVVGVAVVGLVQFAGWAFVILHLTDDIESFAVVSGELQHEPFATARVGSFQTGKLGYFNPGVVNLDGKVNFPVISYLRNDTLCAYLRDKEIEYIVDWPRLARRHFSKECRAREWTLCEEHLQRRLGKFTCWQRTGGGESVADKPLHD